MKAIGPYELEQELGSGAFGRVYRARHAKSGYVRALKVPHDPAHLDDFAEEARLLDRLTHPNIVRFYEFHTNPAYLVFEYVEGESLKKRLERGPVPWRAAVRIMEQVLSALEAAHELGIYHRDIKPANVLLGADGTAKLADFGLGKVVGEASIQASMASVRRGQPVTASSLGASLDADHAPAAEGLAGTWAYMAPEQQRGQPADARSDVYSVGMVLYELLTGRRAELGLDMAPPSELASGVPDWVDEAVLACFRRADRRPQTARDLATVLREPASVVPAPESGSGASQSSPPTTRPQVVNAQAPPAPRPRVELPAGCSWGVEPAPGCPVDDARAYRDWVGQHGPITIRHDRTGIAMVWVPGGSFTMGTAPEGIEQQWKEHRWDDCYKKLTRREQPAHRVDLDAFWLGSAPTTVAQWRAVMGSAPRRWPGLAHAERFNSQGDDHPVVMVAPDDCEEFLVGAGLRLPTEAQWEYAARGTEGRVYPWGNHWDRGRCQSAEDGHGYSRTSPVSRFPNGASWCGGLDMAGNVWEWCRDGYDQRFYARPEASARNPECRDELAQVLRGGSWLSRAFQCRSAYRYTFSPAEHIGFRVSADAC